MKLTRRALYQRLRQVRCLLLDVDGVLTDGKLHFTSDGQELKSFDVHDGHGLAMAQRAGLLVGLVSGRPSAATSRRAADLGINIVAQSSGNKMDAVAEIQRAHQLQAAQIGYVGDELVDLPVLRRVGVAIAVANAVPEVKAAAHYVTRRPGGAGAVREVVELILKAQAKWPSVLAKYLAAVLAAGSITVAGLAAADTVPAAGWIEKFEVPEYDEAGNLKWKLTGDRAWLQRDGRWEIENARAEFYQSNTVIFVFSAPTCQLDRAGKRATTDGPVRLESNRLLVTGTGGDWNDATGAVTVRSNAQVVVREPEPNWPAPPGAKP